MTVDEFLELFEAGEIAIDFSDLADVKDAEAITNLLVNNQFSAWTNERLDEYIRARFVTPKEYRLLACDTGGKCDMFALDNGYGRRNIDWKDLTAMLGVHYEDVSESDFDAVLKG